jgi:hypothetical protein
MAFIFQFSPDAMTTEKYDECMRRLADAGATNPPGRLYHACYGPADRLRVFDVWESPESFQQFGATLLPILQDIGVDPGAPDVSPLHNTVQP